MAHTCGHAETSEYEVGQDEMHGDDVNVRLPVLAQHAVQYEQVPASAHQEHQPRHHDADSLMHVEYERLLMKHVTCLYFILR